MLGTPTPTRSLDDRRFCVAILGNFVAVVVVSQCFVGNLFPHMCVQPWRLCACGERNGVGHNCLRAGGRVCGARWCASVRVCVRRGWGMC